VGPAELPAIDARQASEALRDLPARRPDLLALQAGYGRRGRQISRPAARTVPGVDDRPTRARDTTYTNTAGFSLGITLPLFNRKPRQHRDRKGDAREAARRIPGAGSTHPSARSTDC